MPKPGGYTNASERGKSQKFSKDARDTLEYFGRKLTGGGLVDKAADALKRRRMNQSTDSNNR